MDWFQPKPSWDYDHCEFCMEKFGLREDWLRRGYATEETYRWICPQCFADFREEFGWILLEGTT